MAFYLDVWNPYLLKNVKLWYSGSEIKEQLEAERQARFLNYAKYWAYYEGEQYEADNDKKKEQLGIERSANLPEHFRKHNYSGVISDGIDFINDMLMDSVSIDVEIVQTDSLPEKRASSNINTKKPVTPQEQDIFDNIWDISEMDLVAPDLSREAMISGDSYVLLAWDEINETVKIIPYDAQMVDPIYNQDDYTKIDRVFISYSKTELVEGKERQIDYKEEYVILNTEEGRRECVVLKYKDAEDEPYESVMLGIPFIPIVHIRALRRRVRQTFGDSLVAKIMKDTDRYNSVCQLEFLIAKYNSTGHLALFGDAASIDGRELMVGGEASDFWAFDNAVEAKELFIPTDIKMIESQKETLEVQMYRKIGLQKMNITDLKGLGSPSGYSLEILNRKTEGVFRRIRKELTKSFNDVFNACLDFIAYRQAGDNWINVDPKSVFKNRNIKFNFGSAYIVDNKEIREDYMAGLISLRRALTLKGYSEAEIDEIINDIAEEKEQINANEMESISSIINTKLGNTEEKEIPSE